MINHICDRVGIIYASNIVEIGKTKNIFTSPQHPYTKGLLEATPKIGVKKGLMKTIKGRVLSPFEYGDFCHFYKRCPFAFEKCKKEKPILQKIDNDSSVLVF